MRIVCNRYDAIYDAEIGGYVVHYPDHLMPTSIMDFGIIQAHDVGQVSIAGTPLVDLMVPQDETPVDENQLTLFATE